MQQLALVCCFVLSVLATSLNAQQNTYTSDAQKYLKEIYGSYYEHYFSTPESIEFYANLISRIEYLPVANSPANLMNLSELVLKSKYNPEVIIHDNLTTFDPSHFNPIKYFYNYESNEDQYFRIYNTEWVLKIHKKTH
ncbi:MAG: hypothetical protein H3C31_12065 [Brumimicrobium sp.]|nr:hypothetical protein [Brumimicrobium sp.]MCO5267539.1 hypothetical protein [Brumimicrobium sp.]